VTKLPMQHTDSGLPYFAPTVFRTPNGTPYLKEAGVAMVAMPRVDLSGIQSFLDEFDTELGFFDYLDDSTVLPEPEELIKFMGQACYLSLGRERSYNKDAKRYFDNIKGSGHGSVTEHANFSFFIWGIDRSVTHELVRHRAGTAFSQVSQRYVDGTKLRFVERPEYQADRVELIESGKVDREFFDREIGLIHSQFEKSIDSAKRDYDLRADRLEILRNIGHPMLQGGSRTEARKQVNQAARECLPNCTEAPIGVTLNVRSARHICEMRANQAADIQIRELFMKIYRCLLYVSPILFDDYTVKELPTSRTEALETANRKV
jgi:thymidylate synthase (FAD)